MEALRLNNSLYLSQPYLLSRGVSAEYLRVAKSRSGRSTNSWSHQIINNTCYFSYSTLPRLTALRLESHETLYGKAVETHGYVSKIIHIAKHYGLKTFLKSTVKDKSEEENTRLAVAMSVIHEAAMYVREHSISFRKSPFFKELAEEVRLEQIKYLPVSWRTLRDKIEQYATGNAITDIVRVKNKGNKHRCYLKPENDSTLLTWLLDLGQSQSNYSGAFIHRKIRTLCGMHDMKTPSERLVTNFLAKPETQMPTRAKYARQTVLPTRKSTFLTKATLFTSQWKMAGASAWLLIFAASNGLLRQNV